MTTEERLARALREEADGVRVDVAGLHRATRDRLTAPPAERSRAPRAVSAVAVLAIVVALLGVVGLITLLDAQGTGPADNTSVHAGDVSTTFTCPHQISVDDAGRRQDDSFLPTLRLGPAAEAKADRAPRYTFERDGATARLRLGNADGSLASVSVFRRVEKRWDLVTTTKCAASDGGTLVAGEGTMRLGRHGTTPYSARSMASDPSRAVLLDDRSSYDVAGLVRHRSIWASACGNGRLCLDAGRSSSMVYTQVPPGTRPLDFTGLLTNPDDNEGRPRSFGLWGLWDAERDVTALSARLRDGSRVAAQRFRGPHWTGQGWFVLAERAQVRSLVVRTSTGTQTYPVVQGRVAKRYTEESRAQ